MMANNSGGLIALGMHRSGTSCLAGMLQNAGFAVGTVDGWNPDNNLGNRENLQVLNLNNRILADSEGTWNHPPLSIHYTGQHKKQARAIIQELSGSEQPWMFKDPRTLLTAEMWLDLAPEAKVIGVFRHPLAVYLSLSRRDGMAPVQSISLWSDYNERLIDLISQAPFPLVHFHDHQAKFVDAVIAAVKELFPVQIDAGLLKPEQMQNFFSAQLLHHAPPLSQDLGPALEELSIGAALLDRAQSCWTQLLALQNPHIDKLPEKAAEIEIGNRPGVLQEGKKEASTFRENIDRIDQLLAGSTDQIDLFRQGIKAHQDAEQQTELVDWLGRWLAQEPANPFLLWQLAQLEWKAGNAKAAFDHMETCREAAPNWLAPLRPLAQWYCEAGQWENAAGIYRQLEQIWAVENAKANQYVAQLYVDFGKGFSEADSIKAEFYSENGQVDVVFDCRNFATEPLTFRVDPTTSAVVFGHLSVVAVDEAEQQEEWVPMSSNAVVCDNGTYYFSSADPQLHFPARPKGACPLSYIRMSFQIHGLGAEAMNQTNARLKEFVFDALSDDDGKGESEREQSERPADRRKRLKAQRGQRGGTLMIENGQFALSHRQGLTTPLLTPIKGQAEKASDQELLDPDENQRVAGISRRNLELVEALSNAEAQKQRVLNQLEQTEEQSRIQIQSIMQNLAESMENSRLRDAELTNQITELELRNRELSASLAEMQGREQELLDRSKKSEEEAATLRDALERVAESQQSTRLRDEALKQRIADLKNRNHELDQALEPLRETIREKGRSLDIRYHEIAVLTQLADEREKYRASAERQRLALAERLEVVTRLGHDLNHTADEIESSLSWRIFSRFMRVIMKPGTLGRGVTSLDEFKAQRRALRKQLSDE